MSAKTAVKALLLVFVAASLTSVLLQEVRKSDSEAAAALPEVEFPQDRQITVSYFYTTVRCPTCRKIEAFSKEAVEGRFAR
ncbi:MAG: hypothetical protein IPM24_09960 [Bryobacterales bacterium]|nr:hypothetical protein [Bryobacterales bacterium]